MKTFLKYVVLFLVFSGLTLFVSLIKSADQRTEVHFFDIGQGDSSLIEKGNFQILVDGGPDQKILTELEKVMSQTDKNIEVMILSHPHADHIVGLNQILERYKVDKIYFSGVADPSAQYLEFLSQINKTGSTAYIPQIGQKIKVFDEGEITFLWPGDKYDNKTISNLNNSSLVFRFCQKQCFLFTGDMEADEQDLMLDYYLKNGLEKELKAEVIKVPHHGSKNAANQALYEKVLPNYSIFSVGKDNSYGHPHKEALELGEAFSKNLRTDSVGRIEFILNGESVTCIYGNKLLRAKARSIPAEKLVISSASLRAGRILQS